MLLLLYKRFEGGDPLYCDHEIVAKHKRVKEVMEEEGYAATENTHRRKILQVLHGLRTASGLK
jgi:hypothetical protein